MTDQPPPNCDLDTNGEPSTTARSDKGLLLERHTATAFPGLPCLFLDRDGVIVAETHYLHTPDGVQMIPGMAEAIAAANRAGVAVAVVSNQAGIGRGYYGWDAFESVQRVIQDHLAAKEAVIDAVAACAYHHEGVGPYAADNHAWRKPRPGMLQGVARLLGIDLRHSYIVGDTVDDLLAGMAAGLPGGALTLTGHGRREAARHREILARWQGEDGFRVQTVETPSTAIYAWLEGLGRPWTTH
jgi:D-glycero-D-manno-heptose 1,7-bisphosphate phosphatase